MTSSQDANDPGIGPKLPRVRPTLALPEGIEAGLIGAISVALVYLVRDLTVGNALHTPGVLGTLLFDGETTGASNDPSAGAAAAFHCVHFAIWMVIGLLAAAGVRQVEASRWPLGLMWVAIAVAVVLTVSFDSWASASGLPRVHLWAGALVGFGFMGAYLVWLHPDIAQAGQKP
jgi:phosphoglycerol transferase MdoB-like AlkP superfamily enzyme